MTFVKERTIILIFRRRTARSLPFSRDVVYPIIQSSIKREVFATIEVGVGGRVQMDGRWRRGMFATASRNLVSNGRREVRRELMQATATDHHEDRTTENFPSSGLAL